MSKVYFDKTDYELGYGVFAKKDIRKGELIFIVKGKILNRSTPTEHQRAIQIHNNKWIMPFKDNPGYRINHSCEPNAGIKGALQFVALREIHKGEEITYDYSTSENQKGWFIKCKCSSPNCRGIIKTYAEES